MVAFLFLLSVVVVVTMTDELVTYFTRGQVSFSWPVANDPCKTFHKSRYDFQLNKFDIKPQKFYVNRLGIALQLGRGMLTTTH